LHWIYLWITWPAIKKAAMDKQTIKLIHDIEDLDSSIRDKLIFLANAIIPDAKPSRAWAH
jgi:hypothetical protein